MRGRGGPMGGLPRGGPAMRGGPRGFRGGPMRGGGGDRGGRNFSSGPQGPGPHPVPTIETRGAPPQSMLPYCKFFTSLKINCSRVYDLI